MLVGGEQSWVGGEWIGSSDQRCVGAHEGLVDCGILVTGQRQRAKHNGEFRLEIGHQEEKYQGVFWRTRVLKLGNLDRNIRVWLLIPCQLGGEHMEEEKTLRENSCFHMNKIHLYIYPTKDGLGLIYSNSKPNNIFTHISTLLLKLYKKLFLMCLMRWHPYI